MQCAKGARLVSGFMVRFSNLIYWMGCAGALVMGGLGLDSLIFGSGNARFSTAVFFGIGAGAAWLIGRAARFLVTRR